MDTTANLKKLDIKAMLSTLWIVVMINVAMADIFGFALEIMSSSPPQEFQPNQVAMLVFAFIMEIPIVMIILSRVLKDRANRWANIIAGVVTILFVIAGGSAYLHYYFFATVEIACLLFIIWTSWNWDER